MKKKRGISKLESSLITFQLISPTMNDRGSSSFLYDFNFGIFISLERTSLMIIPGSYQLPTYLRWQQICVVCKHTTSLVNLNFGYCICVNCLLEKYNILSCKPDCDGNWKIFFNTKDELKKLLKNERPTTWN